MSNVLKKLFISVVLVSITGCMNSDKQIMSCTSDRLVHLTDNIDCYIDENKLETNLDNLYQQGWRLIDVKVQKWKDNSKLVGRDVSANWADYVFYYLEK